MEQEKKNSLLIVDDEGVNLKILTHILGDDYTIYTASNGKSAIEKTKEYKPDLILLDIIMPEMDGYETLSVIREIGEIQMIPVIFITGLDSDEDEEKGLSLDAADYITKPFSSRVVKLRVRHQIQLLNQLRVIERLSLIDQLTGIPNRRSFDERLFVEWKQAIRGRTSISVLMIDIDKFKNVNDKYGHQQGDAILQLIANIFPRAFRRPADFAARWGGEEFVVLLPNTPLDGAVDIADKILADVAGMEIKSHEGDDIKITVSIGVNSTVPELGDSITEFISNADKALYAAKDAGRNKAICA